MSLPVCEFRQEIDGDRCRCTCPRVHVETPDQLIPLWYCHGCNYRDEKRDGPVLAGDFTERLLESMGVTHERYGAVKKLFGLSPTCDCDARKQWMNNVDRWVRGLL